MKSFKYTIFLFVVLIASSGLTIHAPQVKDTNDVKQTYFAVLGKYQQSRLLIQRCWDEVSRLYSDSSRHYHNLQHIANFYNELLKCKAVIDNWDAVFLAMVYHDVVYVASKQDNEAKSAALAIAHFTEMGLDTGFARQAKDLIIATASHKATGDQTTDLFIDADMSILGVPIEKYKQYVQQVYQEYAIIPDFAAKRKRFLEKFVHTDRIFITSFFHKLYEDSARYNIHQEINNFK